MLVIKFFVMFFILESSVGKKEKNIQGSFGNVQKAPVAGCFFLPCAMGIT
jgi:hypothetical protein